MFGIQITKLTKPLHCLKVSAKSLTQEEGKKRQKTHPISSYHKQQHPSNDGLGITYSHWRWHCVWPQMCVVRDTLHLCECVRAWCRHALSHPHLHLIQIVTICFKILSIGWVIVSMCNGCVYQSVWVTREKQRQSGFMGTMSLCVCVCDLYLLCSSLIQVHNIMHNGTIHFSPVFVSFVNETSSYSISNQAHPSF